MPKNYVTTTIKGVEFRLPEYYKVIKILGAGAYGCVAQAEDIREKGKLVAIKKISDVMSNLQDAKRCLREIALMQMLNHENIVQLIDFIVPENLQDLSQLYIVLAYKETDLHKVISSKQQLTNEHVQFFMYQIFRGLVFLHSAGVLHRDLKPANLLLDSDCGLQICDFGLARLSAEKSVEQNQEMTEYVSTRYYRSPEILLNSHTYGFSVDIFAAGCILAELYNRRPLFPGRDYINQLNLEIQILDKIQNPSAKQYVIQLPDNQQMDLKKVCPSAPPEAIDLLKQCLQFDETKRPTAEQAMQHPFFAELYDQEDVLKYQGQPITLFFENYPLSRQLLELGFLNCCSKFHQEIQYEVQKRAQQLGIVL